MDVLVDLNIEIRAGTCVFLYPPSLTLKIDLRAESLSL